MSGIAGIIDLGHELVAGSVDLNLLRRMAGQLAHRGPEGTSFWSSGAVGLAHAAMHTTPESELESQPHTEELGLYRLTFDGRLDNRQELRAELEASGQRPRQDTDAELVLRAYLAWGEQCAVRLLGDFAFALWDGRRRLLYCARDIIGLRPFLYSLNGEQFLFASETRALLESPQVSLEPNEDMVAAYLAYRLKNNGETLYQSIRRLPPAHYMIVSPTGIRLSRYWSPDPNRAIRHRTDADYAEHFLEVFRTSVACRLRANGTVGVFLSGGLDSTSILAMALSIVRAEGLPENLLESMAIEFPGMICDESNYVRDMERLSGHPVTMLTTQPGGGKLYAKYASRDLEFPGFPNGDVFFNPLKEFAAARNVRVILNGQGGDEWFAGSYYHYADYLKGLRWLRAVRQYTADRWRGPREKALLSIHIPSLPILRAGVLPLIPERTRTFLKRLLRRSDPLPEWMSDSLKARVRMNGPSVAGTAVSDSPSFHSHAQQDMARMLHHAGMIQGFEVMERCDAHFQQEVRSPFEDRRMIEFGLALPEEQRWRGTQTKFIMREAMRGLIPESVRTRNTKAEFSHLFAEAIVELQKMNFFASLRLAEMGWVDLARAQQAVDLLVRRYESGDYNYTETALRLWMMTALELWIRALDELPEKP